MSLENFKSKSAQRVSFDSRRDEIIPKLVNNPNVVIDDISDFDGYLNSQTVVHVSCPCCGSKKTMKLPSLIRSKNGSYCISCRYKTGLINGSEVQKIARAQLNKKLAMTPTEKVRMWSEKFPVRSQLLTKKWVRDCACNLDWSRKINSYEVSAA